MLGSRETEGAMRHTPTMIAVAALLGLAGCELTHVPDTHGPQWINRSVGTLTDKMGAPDHKVRLPPPSLSVVYLYTGGATPGIAVCEREYFIRGETVIGYSEHGSAADCKRVAGRTD